MGPESPAGSGPPPPARALADVDEPGAPPPVGDAPWHGPPAPGRSDEDRPRRRDRVLWLWPVCAVAVMAVAGQFLGAYGALLAAVVVAATLVLLIGEPDVISVRTRMWVGAAVVVVAAGVVVGRYSGVGFLAAAPAAVEPLDLRGKVVRADDVRGRSLRDALLQGAVLDGLDLRDRDLTGAKAQGASLRRTVLTDARLVDADLRGADLTDACLGHANLSGARLGGVVAGGADVREVAVGVEQVKEAASWPTEGAPVPSHCR